MLRGNNAPFMTKDLKKAIMNRSRFKNRYNKWKSRENFLNLENSIKKVKELTDIAKRNYFKNASKDGVITNRLFWKIMKPLMTNKGVMSSGVIILEENGELISDESKLVDIFNDFYVNIVESAVGSKPTNLGNPSDSSKDRETVLKIIEYFNNIQL